MPALLRLDRLSKAFGATQVLTDLCLEVEDGEVLALLGPSGSGKTTLLRLLAGFEMADAGQIVMGGQSIGELPAARRGIGMVFQHYALFPHLDVGANVAFGLQSSGLSREAAAERVAEVLALVDLAGFEARAVGELSGGQQQRVAVARALAPRPRLLLLDEPLSNLDPGLRERTRRALRRLVREVGITTVLVTHEQQEAFDLGDRIALLYQGRLQQVGTPEELHERPVNAFVAGFVGRANLLPGELVAMAAGHAVRLAGVTPEAVWPGEVTDDSEPGQEVELMLRPEALSLGSTGVNGVVLERRYGGGLSHFRVALGGEGGPEVEVLARSHAARVGEQVLVSPQPQAAAGRIWKGQPA